MNGLLDSEARTDTHKTFGLKRCAVMLLMVVAVVGCDPSRKDSAAADSHSTVEFHVSPTGNDANPGTRERPFASLDRARRAVAQRADLSQRVTVFLPGGTYYLPDTLCFKAADSGTRDAPITYAALPGQTPVISGGQRLELPWAPYKDGIMQATDPAHFTTGPSKERAPAPGFKSYTYEVDDNNRYFLNQLYELLGREDRTRRAHDPGPSPAHPVEIARDHRSGAHPHQRLAPRTDTGGVGPVQAIHHQPPADHF